MENLPADYIPITLERLRKNGMGAFYYPTAREAAEEILRQIPREATVGVGVRSPFGRWASRKP